MPQRSEWLIDKSEPHVAKGMVTSDNPHAAEAGLQALQSGGNAVDAAVTAAFAMGAVEPFTSGVGGVAVAVVRMADGRTAVIDGSTTAPLGSSEDMFKLAGTGKGGMYGWPATVGNENNTGPRSVGAPGMVAALARTLERFGTRSLASAIAPAIALARDGIDLDHYLAVTIAGWADRLWENEEATRIFFKPGRIPLRPPVGLEPGDRLRQPDLARTLERIATDGPATLYGGALGREIVEGVRAVGGILREDDLASYAPREHTPLMTTYRGLDVLAVPECSGGITMVEALNILDGVDLGSLEQSGTRSLHLIAEASRRAFFDRLTHLADPRFASVPFERLASKAYADEVRRTIDPHRAAPDPRTLLAADVPHTTHICAIDADRNMVSLTSTIGGAFGSSVVPRGTGVLLANVMTWFDPRPGQLNSIVPGKRILWAPTPSLLLKRGAPFAAVGSPGGRKLITAVLQSIVNLVDHGDSPQVAVNRPRVHCEDRETLIDSRVRPEVREELRAMGHELTVREETLSSTWFGRPNAIRVDDDGSLRAGVNRLKPAMAAGY